VRSAFGYKHNIAGFEALFLIAYPEAKFTLQNIKDFVLCTMEMK